MPDDKKFCCVEDYKVLIPYRDLEYFAEMSKKVEVMERNYERILEQYAAMRGMFSEVLEIVRETREFVRDS